MTFNVTTTVLTSVFGGLLLVFALYGIYRYLIPHLRQPEDRTDITLPYTQRTADPQLRESLYSIPSPNYIDPRNSVADSELRSSRWSTHLRDLSPPPSPTPRDAQRKKREATSHLSGHKRKHKSQIVDIRKELQVDIEVAQFARRRSKSESMVGSGQGLLARSHATLYGLNLVEDLASPTTSSFTGTTLLSSTRIPHSTSQISKFEDKACVAEVVAELGKDRSLCGSGGKGVENRGAQSLDLDEKGIEESRSKY